MRVRVRGSTAEAPLYGPVECPLHGLAVRGYPRVSNVSTHALPKGLVRISRHDPIIGPVSDFASSFAHSAWKCCELISSGYVRDHGFFRYADMVFQFQPLFP